jgi:hypothetical protein
VKFKKEHLWEMPVLDINTLEEDKKNALLQLYDKQLDGKKICELKFKALPQEFAEPSAARARGHYDYAITYIKRFKALIKPSGIFGQIRPSDKIGYKNADNFLKFRVFKICDSIITDLGKIKNYNKDYIKSILVNISSLICIINMYYMYAKTKVDFAGSYKPAFDIFEKEGL